MSGPGREAAATILRALAWLAPCFVAWSLAAPAIGWLPAKIAAAAIESAAGTVSRSEIEPHAVAYSLELEGAYRPGGSPRVEATIQVPAATYTFGIAIFAALALAARGWRLPARIAFGAALLLPLPAVGIAFDALQQLGSVPQLAGVLGWSPIARELIALGYQAGALLLPTLAPIVAWLALFPGAWGHRPFMPPPAPR